MNVRKNRLNGTVVCLYTFIDENGCFTGPFRLYKTDADNHDE